MQRQALASTSGRGAAPAPRRALVGRRRSALVRAAASTDLKVDAKQGATKRES
jgi:hypothetical protein